MSLDAIVSVKTTDGLVAIAGEIDLASAPTLRQTIEAIETESPRFDLSRVTFIDSTGLHLLIDLRHEFGPLQIVAESCAVEQLLDITGTRAFLIEPAVGESDGDQRPSRVGMDECWDDRWRRVMDAFEDLADAYYGEGRALADAHITDIVMRFVRQCYEMKQHIMTATAESPDSHMAELRHFWSNTRALDICDALVSAEAYGAAGTPKVTARIHRTYTEPNGHALAIIEHAREGEPPRTTDAMVIAENFVNAWTRFVRKQRRAGRNHGASDHA